MGVVIRRCIDILIIIITFPYSTGISSFLAAASLLLCSFFKCFFVLVCYFCAIYSKRCSKNIQDRSKIEITNIINSIERRTYVDRVRTRVPRLPRARYCMAFQESCSCLCV